MKHGKKAVTRLRARRRLFTIYKGEGQRSPGSMNRHKSFSIKSERKHK